MSLTMTVNEQLTVPALFDAVQVTVTGFEQTWLVQVSVVQAFPSSQFALLVQQAALPFTVTVLVQVATLLDASVTVTPLASGFCSQRWPVRSSVTDSAPFCVFNESTSAALRAVSVAGR